MLLKIDCIFLDPAHPAAPVRLRQTFASLQEQMPIQEVKRFSKYIKEHLSCFCMTNVHSTKYY